MTQPELITRALEVLKDPDVPLWAPRRQHAEAALANAYARELDPTPISAEALVDEGWVRYEESDVYEFRCGGPPEGVAVLSAYPRGAGSWATFIPEYKTAKTMGEIRTMMRQVGAYRE